ncbi:MAG: hypothetical protein KatS3mg014_0599 [Actinomycetota bacterium]|nr:MAG: hypothetical protein KatS3mg014_0599 [Actinomycetota bacterium]
MDPRVPQTALERRDQAPGLSRPRGCHDRDRRFAEPPSGEDGTRSDSGSSQCASRRCRRARILGPRANGSRRGTRWRHPPAAGLAGLLSEQRDGQGRPGRRPELIGHLVEDRLHQIAQRGERERALGLDRAADQDPVPALEGGRGGGVEQRRLPRSGLALDDEGPRERVDPVEEPEQGRELLVPAEGRNPPTTGTSVRRRPAVIDVEPERGFEPLTYHLRGGCSARLSYSGQARPSVADASAEVTVGPGAPRADPLGDQVTTGLRAESSPTTA